MSIASAKDRPVTTSRIPAPLVATAAVVALVAVALSLPLRLPVGPMYWDVFVYYDAANRIFSGQVPVVDFFTPVGPLGYYLFAGMAWLFPNAQPILLAHWSLLPLTLPLMAAICLHVGARSKPLSLALLLPFLFFALLPFNTRDYYGYPGSDGFGIYNRQVCQVLYVLVAALMFSKSRALTLTIVTTTVTALFFLKVTGFVSAGIICAYALASGRVRLRDALVAGGIFIAVLAVLEVASGLVSTYVADIRSLVAMNAGSLAPRFLQAASHTFGVIAPGGILILMLLFAERARIAKKIAELRRNRRTSDVAALLDNHALWLGVVMFAGIFFETQNTGSQAMIFVWPALLAILTRAPALMGKPTILIGVVALAAAAYLPIVINTAERAARAWAGSVKNQALIQKNLGTLGMVNMRQDVRERADKLIDFYPGHEQAYADLVAVGELPSFVLYSDFDFQITHLMAIDRAATAVRELERRETIEFGTIMAINFVNPFPWVLDREAPRHIAIGADPTRAVPPPDEEVMASVRDVDIALYPKCPLTTSNAMLWKIYAPLLAEHRRIELTPCYDAYVHPRFGTVGGIAGSLRGTSG